MSVGDKIFGLRGSLKNIRSRNDCVSFSGTPLYSLGMAFFPASLGLYDPDRESVSTIVLGTDWGNHDSFLMYLNRRNRREHTSNQSVSGADRMLLEAGFDLKDCFYSNAWPVMRLGGVKEEGDHPMRDDADFTEDCRSFLRYTITALEPKLVVGLGVRSSWFLAPYFDTNWAPAGVTSSKNVKIKHFDKEPICVRDGVVFVTATHPAHLAANRPQRKLEPNYRDETSLLIYARGLAGIADMPGCTHGHAPASNSI